MNDPVPAGQAWVLLGEDPGRVAATLKSAPLATRGEVAGRLLERARKSAKALMVKNHPDRNPGDAGAQSRFVAVQRALASIEEHTADFQKKLAAKLLEDEHTRAKKVRIEIG